MKRSAHIRAVPHTTRSSAGFSLVELLVVMLILSLLAAIAIPTFFGQSDKARDAAAKGAAITARTAIETYASDHRGSYAGVTVDGLSESLQNIEPTLNGLGARLTLPVPPTDDSYTIQVASETSGQLFRISRETSGIESTSCDLVGVAGCPADGAWAD